MTNSTSDVKARPTSADHSMTDMNPQAFLVAERFDNSSDEPWDGGFNANGSVYIGESGRNIAGKLLDITKTKISRASPSSPWVMEIWAVNSEDPGDGLIWQGTQDPTGSTPTGDYDWDPTNGPIDSTPSIHVA